MYGVEIPDGQGGLVLAEQIYPVAKWDGKLDALPVAARKEYLFAPVVIKSDAHHVLPQLGAIIHRAQNKVNAGAPLFGALAKAQVVGKRMLETGKFTADDGHRIVWYFGPDVLVARREEACGQEYDQNDGQPVHFVIIFND